MNYKQSSHCVVINGAPDTSDNRNSQDRRDHVTTDVSDADSASLNDPQIQQEEEGHGERGPEGLGNFDLEKAGRNDVQD